MNKIFCLSLAICMCLCAAGAIAGCGRAPRVGDIRADVIALVEASYEINEVFFGAGLPVLDRTAEEYADLYAYYAPSTANTYDIVDVAHAKFGSIQAIKAAAARVYSTDLLESNLYVNAFTGYAVSGIGSSVVASDPLYVEDGDYFYQSVSHRNYLTHGMKIFDYDTMKIAPPSTANAVYVTMNAWYASDPATVLSERVRLVRESDGWRLDSLTV